MSTKNIGIFIHPESGNVGIGTSQARAPLEVFGSIVPSSNMGFDLGSPTLRWRDLFLSGNSINLDGTLISRDATSGGIKFETPSGAPVDTFARTLTASNTGTGPALKVSQTGANSIAEFYDDGNALAVKIADGGNVGIGTALPLATLHMNGDILLSKASSGRISLCNVDWWGVAFPDVGSEQKNVATNHYLIGRGLTTLDRELTIHIPSYESYSSTGIIPKARFVATGDKTLLTINATGNVGIGTATPKANLHVQGTFYNPGMVIQSIINQQFSTTHIYNNSVANYNTGIIVTITPKYTNSKIIVQLSTTMTYVNTPMILSLYRDTTQITTAVYRWSYIQNAGIYFPTYNAYVDSPNTTSAITYRVYISSGNGYIVHENSYWTMLADELSV